MVKGVNKTVIEVKDTGSKMFEKIVLYVAPEYGRLNLTQLQKAAGELVSGLEYRAEHRSRRKPSRCKLRLKPIVLISIIVLLIVAAILTAVCK